MRRIADWLSMASHDPQGTVRLWAAGRTAPLLVGRMWELVRTDFTLATAVVTHLKADGRHIGPYLMGGAERVMWWLTPLATRSRFGDIVDVAVYPKGAELFVPPPGKYFGDRVWVLPDQAGDRWNILTSADDLRTAIEAATRQLARPAAQSEDAHNPGS